MIGALADAGLRGLGGAGFPAGRKWRIVRDQPAPRYLAVNIDESEPGTFRDRTCLERDPHRLLEGVLPAAAWPEKTGSVTNTDRIVQLGRRALDPPGAARADLWIIQEMARRLGLDWHYPGAEHGVAAAYEAMREAMREPLAGIPWQRFEREGSVTYPCPDEDHPGQPVVFVDRFPTACGRLRLVPADLIPAAERPDADYPLVLLSGRQLEHRHTGSMTRRAAVLDAIEPTAVATMHPEVLAALGLAAGEVVTVQSRRGEVTLQVRADDGMPADVVFIPFAYHEAAANLLTNPALDPTAKIPELKYCALRVRPGGIESRR